MLFSSFFFFWRNFITALFSWKNDNEVIKECRGKINQDYLTHFWLLSLSTILHFQLNSSALKFCSRGACMASLKMCFDFGHGPIAESFPVEMCRVPSISSVSSIARNIFCSTVDFPRWLQSNKRPYHGENWPVTELISFVNDLSKLNS